MHRMLSVYMQGQHVKLEPRGPSAMSGPHKVPPPPPPDSSRDGPPPAPPPGVHSDRLHIEGEGGEDHSEEQWPASPPDPTRIFDAIDRALTFMQYAMQATAEYVDAVTKGYGKHHSAKGNTKGHTKGGVHSGNTVHGGKGAHSGSSYSGSNPKGKGKSNTNSAPPSRPFMVIPFPSELPDLPDDRS